MLEMKVFGRSGTRRRLYFETIAVLVFMAYVAGIVVTKTMELRALTPVPGVVHDVAVVPARARRGRVVYEPSAHYSYEIGGRRYDGTQFSNVGYGSGSEAEARAHLTPFAAGRQTTVYVWPRTPERAILVKQYPLRRKGMLGVAIVFVVIGWSVSSAWREERRKPSR